MPEKARRLYPYDENLENKELYTLISTDEKQENMLDDIELFDIEVGNGIGLVENERRR